MKEEFELTAQYASSSLKRSELRVERAEKTLIKIGLAFSGLSHDLRIVFQGK